MKWFLSIMTALVLVTTSANAKESLNVGSDEWPPYHYAVESVADVHGFVPVMVTTVLEKMNVAVNDYRIYPWARAVQMVFSGKLDALFTTTKTATREDHCYFPQEPLIKFSYVFFIRKEDAGSLTFNTFDDLKKYTIGVVKGFSYSPEFMDFIKKEQNYEEVTEGKQNFQKLLAKRIDLVAVPRSVGYWQIKTLGVEDEVVLLPKAFNEDLLYIMFSKKTVDEAFVDRFSRELKKYKESNVFKLFAESHHINY